MKLTKNNINKIIRRVCELMDSFLTEAKDQHGNDRSLEQLNADRKLFMENIEPLFEEYFKARLEEVLPKEREFVSGNNFQVLFNKGFNEAIREIEQNTKDN